MLFFAECLDGGAGVRGRQRRPMEGGGDGETDPNSSGLGKKRKVSQVCLLLGGVSPWV